MAMQPMPGFGAPKQQPPMAMAEDEMAMAGAAEEVGAEAAEGEAEGDSNVTPEEQQQYDSFVANALTMIAKNGKIKDAVLKMIESAKDPIEGIAQAAAFVVMRLEDSARDSKVDIEGDVIFHGGLEILEHIAELAEASNIVDELDEEDIEGAFYRAVDIYREDRQQKGLIDQDAAKSDLEELKQADQAGALERMVPGAAKSAKDRAERAAANLEDAEEPEMEE